MYKVLAERFLVRIQFLVIFEQCLLTRGEMLTYDYRKKLLGINGRKFIPEMFCIVFFARSWNRIQQ